MAGMRILLTDDRGLTAYRCDEVHATVDARFSADRCGDFEAYLGSHADLDFAILADVADESFDFEYLPHVRGRSRRRIVDRKRERHARGSSLCLAMPTGRRAEGRRDDGYLFATITRTETIAPWIRALEKAQASVRGVYSLPQIAAALVAKGTREPCVLTTLAHAGLRQTFVVDGCPRFSRLTSLPGKGIDEMAAACAAGAAAMRRYLCGKRMIEGDARLRIFALVHPAQLDAWRRNCRDDAGLAFEYMDIAAEAARCALSTPLPDSHADPLFAHLLARNAPPHQFAPAAVRRQWRLRRAGRIIDVSSWVAFAACLLFAAIQLPGTLRMREAAGEMKAQNDVDEDRYRAAAQEQPRLLLPARDLRQLAELADALARVSPGPSPLLVRASRAMDEFPAIELTRLEWRIAARLEHETGPFAILDLHGILAANGDPVLQQEGIERLASRMGTAPAVKAFLVNQPDASSRATRSTAESAQEDGFVLRVVQRL